MPRYPRKELPNGFILREFPDGTYQAYRESDSTQESPRYPRRLQAVNWCWMQVAQDAMDSKR